MSISNNLHLITYAGDKINFLLQQNGITLFPFHIKNTFDDSNGVLNFSSLLFNFSFLIDTEHLISLQFSYIQKNNGPEQEATINPILSVSSEPLYEFGNEEENLPSISSFKTIYSTDEFLIHIKNKLQQFFLFLNNPHLNCDDVNQAFLKSWNEFCQCYQLKKEFEPNENFNTIHQHKISYHIVSTFKKYDENDTNIKQKIAKLKS